MTDQTILTDDDIFEIVARELNGDSNDLRAGFVIRAEPKDWIKVVRASISEAALPMAPLTGPEALLISQVFAQFRKDACLPGDDRISESFIKASRALMGVRAEPVAIDLRQLSNEVYAVLIEATNDRFDKTSEKTLEHVWKTLRDAAQSEPATRAVPVAIPVPSHRLMHWLKRFNDVCGDAQSEGHDVDKEDMRALAEIGAVRPAPGGRHYTTGYGRYLIAAAAPTPDAERHVANHAGDLAVPKGWKMVPIEPTQEMIIAGWKNTQHWHATEEDVERSYKAAILAAPAQPTDKENGK